jgi:hypothetical protein
LSCVETHGPLAEGYMSADHRGKEERCSVKVRSST